MQKGSISRCLSVGNLATQQDGGLGCIRRHKIWERYATNIRLRHFCLLQEFFAGTQPLCMQNTDTRRYLQPWCPGSLWT